MVILWAGTGSLSSLVGPPIPARFPLEGQFHVSSDGLALIAAADTEFYAVLAFVNVGAGQLVQP